MHGNEKINPQEEVIIFFDGVCNLCNGFVDFVVRHDRSRAFKIASLQGRTAQKILPANCISDLQSVVFYNKGKISTRSTAALDIMGLMPLPWRWLRLFRFIPVTLRDAVYDGIARSRYIVFGRKESCRLPTANEKTYFLE